MMRLTLSILVVTLFAPASVSGQATNTTPGEARPATVTTPANPVPPLEPQGYDYDPSGRRDPFISLVRRTTAAAGISANPRPTGMAGLGTDEFVVRGIIKGSKAWSAMVKGRDNRSYMLRAGD